MATIQKQGRGYKITVSQGYDYTGKRIRQYMTWIPEPGMTEKQSWSGKLYCSRKR